MPFLPFDVLASRVRAYGAATTAIAVALCVLFAGCGHGSSQDDGTPIGNNREYSTALASVNRTQVARKLEADGSSVPTPDAHGVAESLHVTESVLGAYHADLAELRPPPELESAHRDLLDAVDNLIKRGQAIVAAIQNGTDEQQLLPLLQSYSDGIADLEMACHVVSPEIPCSSLIGRGVELPTSDSETLQ